MESRSLAQESVRTTSADSPESDVTAKSRVVYESSINYLEEYWGARWPALRAELEAYHPERLKRYEAFQLTEDLIPPPLSEIEDEIIQKLLDEVDADSWINRQARFVGAESWPDALAASFVARLLGLLESEVDEDLIRACQLVANSHRELLADYRQRYHAAARDAVERQIRAGAYVVWPLVQVGHGMDPRTGKMMEPVPLEERIFSLSVSHWGLWLVHLYIKSAQYPNVQDLKVEMKSLGAKRMRDVQAILKNR